MAFNERAADALPVLKAYLALTERYCPNVRGVLTAQGNLATCLGNLGRSDEAVILEREIYDRRVAMQGISHEETILTGNNLVGSLINLKRLEEAKSLLRDQLLPAARQSLGADHHITLGLNLNLVMALKSPEHTRDYLRSNQHRRAASTRPTQATTC